MRVGVDMISAGAGLGESAGGMVVYYDGLLRALSALKSPPSLVTFVNPARPRVGIPADASLESVACVGLPQRRAGRVAYEHLALPRLARRAKVDVLLSTCNTRPFTWKGPSVVVLQSLQYLLYPHAYERSRLRYLRYVVPRSLRDADLVIAVSEWEREEAIERFSLEPDRVVAVYHGVSATVTGDGTIGSDLPELSLPTRTFVSMVSTLYEHKNHRRLIEGFARAVAIADLPHSLVLVGGDGDVTRAELEAVADRAGVADRVVFVGALEHRLVPAVLRASDAVAYVSECETFGHPVVEALALSRPLVTSAVGATKEIAGDAAVLVDPLDADDIARGLVAALTDDRLRTTLMQLGPARAAEFTWERCAARTADVLRIAVERHRGVLHG